MADRIYTGMTVRFALDTGIQLDDNDECYIVVKKPDGTIMEWPAEPVGTTVVYITNENDLDQPGYYEMQAKIIRNGQELLGDTTGKYVYEPL